MSVRGTKISPSSTTVTLMTLLIAHTDKNNKIEQEQEVNSFFTAMNQQTLSYFHSS